MVLKQPKKSKKYTLVTDKVKDAIITRYLRYCFDQHIHKSLAIKSMVDKANFTFQEKLRFRMRVCERRDLICCDDHGEYKINVLPDCLNPKAKGETR